jgi:periodic tryptophan protein 1
VVLSFDTRALPSDLSVPSPSLFTLQAHHGACSALDVNPHIRGCIATGGTDKRVKVWNIIGGEDGGTKSRNVTLVTGRDLGVVSSSLDLHSFVTFH